jgi:molybdenum cofactor cytidylyltransferase
MSSSVKKTSISAIVVAAGLSTRMGEPKQLLPYGKHTVIEQIVSVLSTCSLDEILVITGHERQAIEAKLAGWPVRAVFNPDYEQGEMLSSVQRGLAALEAEMAAALIVLSDQPQIEAAVVQRLINTYRTEPGPLIIPSFQMRRGHPILIDRACWPEILALDPSRMLREVIRAHAGEIHYVVVETEAVLRDIDTPEAYLQALRQRALKQTAAPDQNQD